MNVIFSCAIDDVEVVWAECFPPSYLTSIECLGGHEIDQVFMVSVDGDREPSSFQIMSPFLAGGDDSHKLLIVYLIIKLRGSELLG